MKEKGSQLIVEALKQEGVDLIFGYPGGAVIPIFDALYSEKSIHVILTRHEQAAIHAADGYARSTGKPGVCIVTSGPGATNTVTGLATANFDSIPIICITGQVSRNMIGNDAFQEADTVGITRPVTKHNYLVTERSELGVILKNAFFIAKSGRPGPVVVDVPNDICTLEYDDVYPETVSIRGYNPVYEVDEKQLKKAAALLQNSNRPLFFIGGGLHISDAETIFRKIVKKTGVPVVSSLMGIGIMPQNHPDYLGMIGMHGTYAANMSVTNSDLLFSLGVRFDDRATGNLSKFAPNAKIVHIDIDPAAIARNVPVDLPIIGDARLTLEALYPMLTRPQIDEWRKRVRGWVHEYTPLKDLKGSRLSPALVIEAISEEFPDAIISTEVGQNQMWAATFYAFKSSRTWLTSGGLGTMGYGFPAAIGAQAGNPGKRVIDIAGDGSFQMNIQEMATAVLEGLPVIVALLNNGYLGMVRQWQEMFYNKHYSSTCLAANTACPEACSAPGAGCPPYVPDFVKLAEAYGAVGLRAHTMAEVKQALKTASRTTDRPIIIDFLIEREANVLPMVAPGAGIDEMFLGKEK
ncbi:MAG: biosynthetic-type acetolactate synthase large subunit [Spirochaetota bacterium]